MWNGSFTCILHAAITLHGRNVDSAIEKASCKISESVLSLTSRFQNKGVKNMADDQGNQDSLRQFVADECKAQATERSDVENPENVTLDAERMNNFYQRALRESERMSNEVTRSHMQRSELHKELGADMFKSWTQDHAQEVLSSERYELWSKEEEKAEEALKQLKNSSICEDESSDDASH